MTYNQAAHSGQVRIGNWFEELKLKEETGIRFYPSPTDKKNSLLTKARCIVHTDQVLPKNYTTENRDALVIPQKHPEYRGPVRGPKSLGPRRMLLEEKINREVEEEFSAKEKAQFEETRKTDYSTLNRSSYTKENFESSLKERDANSRIPTRTAGYITETPVTVYSHAYQSGKVGNFPCTFVGSVNPFKKSNAFSADIRKELIAPKAETNQRPRPLPTLLEFSVLNDLRSRILLAARQGSSHSDGNTVRSIIAAVWQGSTEDSSRIEDLAEVLSSNFGVDLSHKEKDALLSAMDTRSDGYISLPQFTNFIRPSLSPRRMELLEQIFGAVASGENFIIYEALPGPPFNPLLTAFLTALRITEENKAPVQIDDFFDYYTDVSAEMPAQEDAAFEQLLKATWTFQ